MSFKNQILSILRDERISKAELGRRLDLSPYQLRRTLEGLNPMNVRKVAQAIGYAPRIVLVKLPFAD